VQEGKGISQASTDLASKHLTISCLVVNNVWSLSLNQVDLRIGDAISLGMLQTCLLPVHFVNHDELPSPLQLRSTIMSVTMPIFTDFAVAPTVAINRAIYAPPSLPISSGRD
jgi:hypothetical protein